jgi:hypothetical protein
MKNDITSENVKQTGVAILISDTVDFKSKLVRKERNLLHINKRNNRSRSNTYTFICTKIGIPNFIKHYWIERDRYDSIE